MYFPKSRLDEFKGIPKDSRLRIGQQFHHFMKLEKVTGIDKPICDKIYEISTYDELIKFINIHIDIHN
jgi:hypothetical protein